MNLFDLFATINLDSSEYENGLDDAEKSSSNFAEKLKSGLGTAGKVGAAAIGAVTTAGVAMAGALTKGAADLAAYGDEIDKNSQKMGISAQAYQEWDAILQHSGSSISAMQKGMLKLQTSAADGSEAFKKLGLSQEKVAKMSTEDLFSAVISGLQDMEEGSERTALAQELLGGAVKELGPLLNTSSEETEAMRKQVHELGGVLSNETVKSAAAFQDSLQDMKTAMGGVKNSIVSDMLPGLTSLMDGFTQLISGSDGAEQAISNGMSSLMESVSGAVTKIFDVGQKIVPALMSSVIENLPIIAESGIELINAIALGITDNLPALVDAGLQIIQKLAESFGENLPELINSVITAFSEIASSITDPETLSALTDAALAIITALAEGLTSNMESLTDTFLMIIDNLITFVLDNLPKFIDAAVQIIIALVNGLTEALPTLLGYLPTIIESIITGLLDNLPKIVEAGVTLLTALIQNLPLILETIAEKLPEIIEKIVDTLLDHIDEIIDMGVTLLTALIDNLPLIIETICGKLPKIITEIITALVILLPKMVSMGVTLFTALIENLPKAIENIVRKLPEIITSIVDGLMAGIGSIVDVGVAIVEGLWEGIKSLGGWIWDKATGFIGGVVDGIANFLGISSPSKVFAEMGEMIDRGLVKGIEDYAHLAVEAAKGMAEDVVDAVDPNIDFTADGSAVGEMLKGRGTNVVINVQGAEGQDVNELAEIISQRMAFTYAQDQVVWA